MAFYKPIDDLLQSVKIRQVKQRIINDKNESIWHR